MQLIGFNFNKIEAERFSDIKGASGVKINSNINFPLIEKQSVPGLNEELVKVDFTLDFTYDPKLAEIKFKGTMLFKSDEEAKELLKESKKKEIPSETHKKLMNTVLRKCTVRALQLEDELGIPYHISLPRLQ